MNKTAETAIVNIDAEQALLGACLMSPDAIDAVDGLVRPEDFSEDIHGVLFRAMQESRADGLRINATLLKSVLGSVSGQTVVGFITVDDYIARLAANATTVVNAPDFARIISDAAKYRSMVETGERLIQRASHGYAGGPLAQTAIEAVNDLDDIVTSTARSNVRRVTAGQAVEKLTTHLSARRETGDVLGLSWGVKNLDDVYRLVPGELIIAAARPSMGKTTLGLSTAAHNAKSGHGVLFVSLEMGDMALATRLIADACFNPDLPNIPYTNIRDNRLNASEYERVIEAAEKINGLPLYIEQESALTAAQIATRARKTRQLLINDGSSLDLLIVDHLGLMGSGDRYAGARHLELGVMTAAMKALAKELDIPVLLLCQLSRGVESRDNKRPQLSDLRESGRIEEDADVVVLLYREAYYLERAKESDAEKDAARVERLIEFQNSLELNIAKNRSGATRSVEAFVNMPTNTIRTMLRRY